MINFLTSITFQEDHRCFKRGFNFKPLQDINLLVGDQGCGKSTLLKLLAENSNILNVQLHSNYMIESMYLDTEKDNPRMCSDLRSSRMPAGYVVGSHFHSHGETLLPLVSTIKSESNKIILLDEPEAGLSIRSQHQITKAIHQAASQDCQIFVATHSIIVMESVPKVFSLEHKNWMSSQDFIQSQKA